MLLDPRSAVVGYAVAKAEMSAQLADLRARMEARIEAEWAALGSELAAAQAELRAARAELENLKVLRAADDERRSQNSPGDEH